MKAKTVRFHTIRLVDDSVRLNRAGFFLLAEKNTQIFNFALSRVFLRYIMMTFFLNNELKPK